jgi:heterodisulfide reductase subunit A
MVIGGGIAGIQTAIDLAEAGIHVILVEKQPSIGGKMAALDKNFPTLDCSICIEAPKMSEAMTHPNIDIRTMTEVTQVEGEAGDFTVKLREKARYVSDECTRCGECALVCPNILPNEFDYGTGFRKGIYTPFQQSEPGAYVIDMDVCLNRPPNYLPCYRCVDACLPKCIDFNMKPFKEYEEKTRSIVVTTGFDLLDPALLKEYGYGQHPDVLTSIEYERILNSAGPTDGNIIRPSNHKEPESILFILCVGSRDQRLCPYCSRVCCMYTAKEAIQSVDHGIKNVTILYMDIRAYGKGFDEFYHRSIEEGVKYVRGRPAKIDTTGQNLKITYENTDEMKLMKEKFDLVVLATALLPAQGTADLAKVLGIDLDSDGFIKTMETQGFQVGTTRSGIYVSGCSSGPKDIPDSVTEASAAAAAAMIHIKNRDWPKEEFEETISPSGEPKIGVFVCDCGSNIAGVADVPDIVKYAEKLDNVVHSEELMFACAGTTQATISDTVKEKGINRLVIAACSPKTHNPTFQRVCMRAGLNKYLLEMSNIRNHNTWVHKKFPVEATEKSKDMISMAVEKAKLLTPLQEIELPLVQRALVVGAGIAGINAATNLSKQGFETHLVERSNSVGGLLKKLDKLAPSGANAETLLSRMEKELTTSNAHVHLNTTVETVSGTVGNFHVQLNDNTKLDVGAIILAYGSNPYIPTGFDYGKSSNVITNVELEDTLEKREENNITFLSCVGSRSNNRGCSRYCCQSMIYQAIRLIELGKRVTILHKGIRTFSRHAEEMYYEACKRGVIFIQYPESYDPEKDVIFDDGKIIVTDEYLGSKIALPTDLLVLVVGLHPPDDHSMADMLKVSKTEDEFLLELHPKLAPIEAAVHGVFLAGSVRGPLPADEAVSQGLGAAAKAVDLLAKGLVVKEPHTARINPEVCTGCHLCTTVCPYNAIEGEKKEPHKVIEASCMSCGTCAAECSFGAITMPGFTDEQIFNQIDAALVKHPEEKIIVFTCNWCSYAGADQAGIAKIQYPPSSRIIRMMCSGRISRKFVERAFDNGAGAILVTGCRLMDKGSDCHYNHANVQTLKRYEKWKRWIERKGIKPERLQLQWVSAAEGRVLAHKLEEMEEILKQVKKSSKTKGKKTGKGGIST